MVKSGCLTRTFFGQRLKLSLLGRRDQRLKRAEIDLIMGMMMAMNHDSGHVGDDVVHPKAGEGGRADPGEHRLVERQAQGGSDCPSGLVITPALISGITTNCQDLLRNKSRLEHDLAIKGNSLGIDRVSH